jgi:hypothetical protein
MKGVSKMTEIRNEHAVTIAGSRQYATVVRRWKTATGPNAMSVAQKGASKRNHEMIHDTQHTYLLASAPIGRMTGSPAWYVFRGKVTFSAFSSRVGAESRSARGGSSLLNAPRLAWNGRRPGGQAHQGRDGRH